LRGDGQKAKSKIKRQKSKIALGSESDAAQRATPGQALSLRKDRACPGLYTLPAVGGIFDFCLLIFDF
jgi:hypothetical protein